MSEQRVEVVWRPQIGPQKALVDCPAPEVFFGGARGGGKTDGVLGKWALKERRYGSAFNAVGFRRTSVSFEDAIERAKQIYLPLDAKYTDKPARFRMPNGGRISFAHLENIDDAQEYQGRNVTDAWVEEVGQYPDPAPIDRLFGMLRSAAKVPIQLIVTGNPGGPGQHWIAKRYDLVPFPRGPRLLSRALPNGAIHQVAVIPSRVTDNRLLIESDPGYLDRMQLVGSAALIKAWLEGDWSAIEGAFFPEWSTQKHVLAPFTIPDDWLRFRSADWGSARPFSIGWWAVVGDAYPVEGFSQLERSDDRSHLARAPGIYLPNRAGDPHLKSNILPRGALIRYREWYGSSAPNVGLKMPAEEVADGIVSREMHEPRDEFGDSAMTYGVLDPAAFASDGGPSIAERMAGRGVIFTRADNKRVAQRGSLGGWDQVRMRLVGTADRDFRTGTIDWSCGEPMLYFFSTCVDSIRTLPALQHDRGRAEDVDTDSEDHAPDEIRYACMSRPWVNEVAAPTKPRFLQDATLDELWEANERPRAEGRI